ncbi:MAG TPA: hypothetical protein VG013_38645 [Gemmataceae bacterium]|nr:hypothetical protein [Gemmataceae bacterium]
MRNLLALAALVLLAFVGLGWYLDWYHVKSAPADTAGHQSVNIDINGAKILDDVHKGEEKIHKVVEKHTQPGETVKTEEKQPDGPLVPVPND